MRRRGARPGIALLTTLMGILVLEVVIAGAFHVAMQQRRIATAYARGVQLEAAARSAAAAALTGWPALGADTLALGTVAAITVAQPATPGMRTSGTLRRVAPEVVLLRLEAEFPASGERRAVAVVLRELTLARFLGAVQAAAVARTATVSGTVRGLADGSCALPAEVSLVLPALLLEDTAAAGGSGIPPAAYPRFGRFAGLDLAALDSAPPGLVVRRGDQLLEGSAGPALFVVDGDLTVAAGAQIQGLLLVRGSVRLLPGASLRGAVQLGGGLEVTDAAIHYDPCVLGELFRSQPALRGPLRGGAHWWIPAA